MTVQSCVTIRNEWDIVAARQMGRNVAKEMGFGTVDQARITTAISELARNIYLYAGTGQVCLEAVTEYSKTGLRIIAQDNGPGIANIRQVMEDGYSTSGGLGAGLPGVKRLMDSFQIDSNVGEGTRIEAVKWVR
ncbi:anti-sigma regulatory factor [Sutcliffiella cohnii]|uniref:ATP-binding protein n=1 Tax=Sutcliffiella cohnii TaxID=33932 RepID=A0A223KXJ1_9BACI|nr:anti-sigma regulatory factor [Sutcliffiella cohnii]AST94133.1 ATP-binding protein [Sutcliffiella cohnii]